MYHFWDSIVHPLVELLSPTCMVEIGVERGRNTEHLVEYCVRTGSTLHLIDPLEPKALPCWQERMGEKLIFHKDRSLRVLPSLSAYDVVFLDGDHNWYTVFHELCSMERSVANGGYFPTVILHDVCWPCAYRDFYYDPETIPPTYRKEHSLRGINEHGVFLEKGGTEEGIAKAVEEHTPQNGVLCAVEDFLTRTKLPLRFITLPGLHGLGILVQKEVFVNNPALETFLQSIDLPPHVQAHIAAVEEERLRHFHAFTVLARERETL